MRLYGQGIQIKSTINRKEKEKEKKRKSSEKKKKPIIIIVKDIRERKRQ